jgi:hypothetical protein
LWPSLPRHQQTQIKITISPRQLRAAGAEHEYSGPAPVVLLLVAATVAATVATRATRGTAVTFLAERLAQRCLHPCPQLLPPLPLVRHLVLWV